MVFLSNELFSDKRLLWREGMSMLPAAQLGQEGTQLSKSATSD